MPTWLGWHRLSCTSYAALVDTPLLFTNSSSECDSLADGQQRRLREDGKECECKEGWGGINCNGTSSYISHRALNSDTVVIRAVCKTNNACRGFPLAGEVPDIDPEDMLCYQGGETVFNVHQMCDVTSKQAFARI